MNQKLHAYQTKSVALMTQIMGRGIRIGIPTGTGKTYLSGGFTKRYKDMTIEELEAEVSRLTVAARGPGKTRIVARLFALAMDWLEWKRYIRKLGNKARYELRIGHYDMHGNPLEEDTVARELTVRPKCPISFAKDFDNWLKWQTLVHFEKYDPATATASVSLKAKFGEHFDYPAKNAPREVRGNF